MKILVTGGLGFIGSNLVRTLVGKGHEVSVIDNLLLGKPENVSDIKDKIQIIIGDVNKRNDLEKAANPDIIFHMAASSSSPMFQKDLKGCYRNNIEGFINVLEFARDPSTKKVIYASTSSIYGNNPIPLREDDKVIPPNYYSVTKLDTEYTAHLFSKANNLECIGFRFMSVYGPAEKSKGKFANLASQFLWEMQAGRQPILYGDGKQRRDFTHVDDIVQANILTMETDKKFGSTIFNIGENKDLSLLELVEIINKVLGTDIKPKFIPNPVKGTYIYTQLGDLTKIKKELGYEPKVSLEEGLRRLAEVKE